MKRRASGEKGPSLSIVRMCELALTRQQRKAHGSRGNSYSPGKSPDT